jgi:thiol-disulfide isomerase/thioredoxin
MKPLCTLLLIGLISLSGLAQGIQFHEGSWEEALAEAKKKERLIFVDAYASWCGPCKRMAATVFVHEKIGQFFNANFINVKIDMERGEGPAFGRKYPVSAYPTLFFIDPDGELVHKQVGGQSIETLLKLGEVALSKVDFSKDYGSEYEAGNRDPELVYQYIRALNQSKKPSLKVTNDFLRDTENFDNPFVRSIILEGTTEADSRIFDLLIEHRKAIEKQEGSVVVQQKIEQAIQRTLEKGIEFQVPELVEEAKTLMSKHASERAQDFGYRADVSYAFATGDIEGYRKAVEVYAKKSLAKEPEKLYALVVEVNSAFPKDKGCRQLAEKLAKDLCKKSDNFEHHFTYARILADNGKKKEALDAAEKTLKLAPENNAGVQRMVQRFIDQLHEN